MKRYRVTIDGRVYDIEIDDPRARPVTARLSGTAYSVDVEAGRRAGPGEAAPEAPLDTSAAPSKTDPVAETTPTPGTPAATSASASSDAGPQTLQAMNAPIPGVVSTVAVLAGQKVARGDELLTIEAMKMFNVMRSPRGGTVATVHVKAGDRVVQGQPLVTYAT